MLPRQARRTVGSTGTPRVALLTYSTRPRGGVVHTLALAEALADLGTEVSVWTLSRKGDTGFFRPVDPRVDVHVVPLRDRPEESVGERVSRSIRGLGAAFEDGYDIVHAQDCISANAVPGAIRTVHHLEQFTTPQLAQCHERALRTPPAHLCVSHAVAEQLRAGWGIETTVIPNGVDAERFTAASSLSDPVAAAARHAWRARLGRYVLAVGGIEPRKGTRDLIEAMALLARTDPDARLVIAGGETLFDYRGYRAEVDELAAHLGVRPTVLGPVAHDELPSLVAAAGAFAFPSTNEGFGLAAMEALAAGVPVVARDLPVTAEVLGNAARLADGPADLARHLSAALNRRESCRAARGRALAGSFSWSAAAQAHLAFYAQHAAGSMRSSA